MKILLFAALWLVVAGTVASCGSSQESDITASGTAASVASTTQLQTGQLPTDQSPTDTPLSFQEQASNEAFAPTDAYTAQVARVIDGDTIVALVEGEDVTVRLIGIDTPESSVSFRPQECGGEEASQFLRQLLPEGSDILLTRDEDPMDDYGRMLGYVFRAEDGLFVNLAMAQAGLAEELSFQPNTTYASHIRRAVAAARAANRGAWGICQSLSEEL